MEENNNIYVSSRGLLKSCDYFSLTPYSSTRQLYNYPQLETIKNVKNPSIYICSSAIPHFINVMLPQIDFSFILVSGDCDEIIPDEILNNNNFINLYLRDGKKGNRHTSRHHYCHICNNPFATIFRN